MTFTLSNDINANAHRARRAEPCPPGSPEDAQPAPPPPACVRGGRGGIRRDEAAALLRQAWAGDPRWAGIERRYDATDVIALRGSVVEAHTLAGLGAARLWDALHTMPFVRSLGALTGNQAVQMVKAGLQAIYLSGWQVAADANLAGQTYPDQSLYPANSVPAVVRRINNALVRADQIAWAADDMAGAPDYLVPIVADAEAGFGSPLNVFELTKAMISAGAAGVHFEDQLASEKKCGHLGGKVLVPTAQHVRTLNAARLAADIAGVPTLVIARTDALAATLLTSDVDPVDAQFCTGERTDEGFYRVQSGLEPVLARARAYAPFADLIWVETGTPDLGLAREFAAELHRDFPGKMLAYNCSPSFNWQAALDESQIASFQDSLGEWGYKFQFITLAGFHSLNHSMFHLSREYAERGMSAYVELQRAEFADQARGYTAVKHQAEVGTGYFDRVASVINPAADTLALAGSTETEQF
jgi:isocitrate lyase